VEWHAECTPPFSEEHFLGFDMLGCNRKGNYFWSVVWLAVVWIIWSHRNNILFRNRQPDVEEVFALVQRSRLGLG